ncbi:MAG: tetratricopeptide repeat protein, partial [Bacteroidetes bacterium]|nr:tetratricopeptide repeat protein [Bacteroidota bacterium]
MMTRYSKIVALSLFVFLTACSQQKTAEEYIQSGQALMASKEWKGAIIEFKNAVKQSPENAEARALLGKAYVSTVSTNAALKELKRAIDLGYDKNAVLLALGKAYKQINDNEKIINEIKVNDSLSAAEKADIHALRAEAFLRTNKKQEAESELNSAKAIDEKRPDVRIAWARYEGQN